MAPSAGLGWEASSAIVLKTMPGVQNPHWAALSSANARCTGCSPVLTPASPSIVVTVRPATDPAVRWQDLTGSPSTKTVHAPHAPSPQPSFAPVRPSRSRSAGSNGTEAGSSADELLIVRVMVSISPSSAAGFVTSSAAGHGADN